MIYIRINNNKEIEFIHYCPFDSVHGLGKTEEQLLQEGKLVNSIPKVSDIPDDKMVKYRYIEETNSVEPFLVDKPLTSEEEQAKKISILEGENKSLREGLQAVLSGDMQSLAYILYPKDFADVNNTTLEL